MRHVVAVMILCGLSAGCARQRSTTVWMCQDGKVVSSKTACFGHGGPATELHAARAASPNRRPTAP